MTTTLTQPYSVVIPSIGRQSLNTLLEALARQKDPLPAEVLVVDDRPGEPAALPLSEALAARVPVRVLRGLGRGPAAARNLGWRVASSEWVVFLDDDVEVPEGWSEELAHDLTAAAPRTAGVQARLEVPLPDRRPTDWERTTAGLMGSHWITADMAYRRSALVEVRGFDERFPRAYREDADLAARVLAAGWQLERGTRRTVHPLRPQPGWHASVRAQRGNADDALMRRAHGRRWRESSGAGRGRLPWHVATVAAGTTALAAGLGAARVPRRRGGSQRVAAVAGATWLALSSDFALRRIAAGPPQPAEWVRMATTSVLIPPVALWQRLSGRRRHRGASAWPPAVRAVLFDRDGTLVVDVPYNTDPGLVQARPHAREALDLLRCNGMRVGVVTNQSGVGRGTISGADLAAVNGAVEEQLGPFDTWQVCRHTPEAGCACRKPGPALVLAAARELGVRPEECVVVGDIETDLLAARAAGARSVLVPTSETLAREVADAPVVATDLLGAAHLVLEGAL